jgi:cytochrome P450
VTTRGGGGALSDDWCAHHFDHLSPDLARELHPTLARMRGACPVAHSDQHGGFWVATRYEDVLGIAQDWATFSSAHGVSVPETKMTVPAIPEHLDPPLQRTFKRLINAHFTPAVVSRHEDGTRELVTRLIDGFVESGRCDFMAQFARPFPGLAFFDMFLNAPPGEVAEVNDLTMRAAIPGNPDARECWAAVAAWIKAFVDRRRDEPPRGDVVDAVLQADIDGRPITEIEVIGTIQLLVLGGLDTTAGALGQFMIRFAEQPEIPTLLRERPELIPDAVEELLRLDGPFIAIGRTAMHDTDLDGHQIGEGEKVLMYWASANRDEGEFTEPERFDLDRPSNRHLAFGAGPHRCAGSHLARMNLRIAVEELVHRLHDVELDDSRAPVEYHSVLNRAPLTVPITFTPGAVHSNSS